MQDLISIIPYQGISVKTQHKGLVNLDTFNL